jgi:hypothetical protein
MNPKGADMMNKNRLYSFLILLILISMACSVTNLPGFHKLETGAIQSFTFKEPYPGTMTVQDVSLSVAFGEFNLTGGEEALLEGAVRYNVDEWEPRLTHKNNALTVSQGENNFTVDGVPGEDVVNEWNVKLGNVPMNLTLEAGAYEATLDLSGIPLQNLVVQDGAADSKIRFDTLNPEEMKVLAYQTGTSKITFLGLANANFTQMSFEGGAGEYTFDFTGDLQRDANVNIQVGLSDLTIVVPKDVSAKVFVDEGLSNIKIWDAWTRDGVHFENKGSGPQLTITVEMGAGSLRLANE